MIYLITLTLSVLSIIFGKNVQSSKWKARSWPKGPVLSLITPDFIFFIRKSLREAMVSVSVYLFLISMSKTGYNSHKSLIITISCIKMERTLFILKHSLALWNRAIGTNKADKNKIWCKKSQIFESISR